MKPRIAILAAMPREIAPLVADWPVHSRSRKEGWVMAENDNAIAVCAGMGRERVSRALELAENRGPLRSILSVGYAGALRPGIAKNTLYWAAMIVDAGTGERYDCEAGKGTLVTMNHVVDSSEKPEIAERWNADMVDMEAATVARLARKRGLQFRALRVISDEADDMLPDLNRFIDAHGRFRQARFATYLVFRPPMIVPAIRLGRTSTQASARLAEELGKLLRDAE